MWLKTAHVSATCALIILLGCFPHTPGALNYTILVDFPFQVNLTTVQIMFNARLNSLPAFDGGVCLKLHRFKFMQIPALNIYTPLDTLLQVSQNVQGNRTILIAGNLTYFGKKMRGANLTNDPACNQFQSCGANAPILSYFWFPQKLYYSTLLKAMLTSIQVYSKAPLKEKIVIVMYSPRYVQDDPFFEESMKLENICGGLSGSVTVIYFAATTNGAIIAKSISALSGVTTIITILTGEDTSSLLLASISQSLLRWTIRWIVCLLEGSPDLMNVAFNDIDTRNVTVLTFGPAPNSTLDIATPLSANGITINTTVNSFLYDMTSSVMTSLAYAFCPAKRFLPTSSEAGITGNYTYSIYSPAAGVQTWNTQRSTYVLRVYRGLGTTMQYDTDIILNSTYHSTSSIPAPRNQDGEWKRKRPVKILFYKNEPDNIYKWNASRYTNFNDQITGYMVELLKELITRANLTYTFELANPDISTGVKDPVTGTWDGILGLVKNGSYDLSSSLLTWTPDRAADFDTVRGVMYYSISLLTYTPPSTFLTNFFQFLNPLHWTMWLAVLGTTIAIAVGLTLLHRISPNKNSFSFYESFFFSVGSLLHGVTVDPPNRYSGRLMACALFYFCFVVFAMYIANYGAIFTKQHLKPTISSISDLLRSTPAYSFGIYKPSQLFDILWSSNNLNERIMAKMMAYDFTNTTGDYNFDVDSRVRNGSFVFIDESPNNDFRAYKNCYNSSGYFGSFEYVLYLSKYNDLTSKLQKHLDAMIDENRLDQLQSISWPTTAQSTCTNTDFYAQLNSFTAYLDSFINSNQDKRSLGFDEMGGIFVITLGGCVLSIVLALFEWRFRATIQRLLVKPTGRQNRRHLDLR